MTSFEHADEVDAIDETRPSEPVLRLWEALCDAGGMPAMRPEHVRAMKIALDSAWRQGLADALNNDG